MNARRFNKDLRKQMERYIPQQEGWTLQVSHRKSRHFKVYAPDGVFCGVFGGTLNSDRSLENAVGYFRQWRKAWEERR